MLCHLRLAVFRAWLIAGVIQVLGKVSWARPASPDSQPRLQWGETARAACCQSEDLRVGEVGWGGCCQKSCKDLQLGLLHHPAA